MGTFVYERESDHWVIYDLRRGHDFGRVAIVYDADHVDALLAALERTHGRNRHVQAAAESPGHP